MTALQHSNPRHPWLSARTLRKHREWLVIAGVASVMLAISGAGARGAASSQRITDAQQTQISWSYALNPYLRSSDLDVSVRNGEVTLSGQVNDGANKALAEQIARGVTGVRDVRNRIVVRRHDYAMPDPALELSYAEVIYDGHVEALGRTGTQTDTGGSMADRWVTTKVKSTLLYAGNVDGGDIAVHTRGGVVTLSGVMRSGAERALAIQLASNVRGVRNVRAGSLTLVGVMAEEPRIPLVAAAREVPAACPPRWVCHGQEPQRRISPQTE